MATVEEKVYSADSDDYKIITKETYTSLAKEKRKQNTKVIPSKILLLKVIEKSMVMFVIDVKIKGFVIVGLVR